MSESSVNLSSAHYSDESGRRYFENFQDPISRAGSFLSLPLYENFVRPTDVVLDFACGGGYLLRLLHAKRKLGVEANPVASAAARNQGIEVFERLEDVPDATADIVVSNHGLEHTLRPYDVLLQLRRIARPRGRLVLYLPADSWWRDPSFRPGDVNHHVYTWTPLNLGNLLGDAGWDVITSRLVFHAWPPRGYGLLRHLPPSVAQGICRVCAIVLMQPQVHAEAVKREA
jgi:SAM-dependent methyltransferase